MSVITTIKYRVHIDEGRAKKDKIYFDPCETNEENESFLELVFITSKLKRCLNFSFTHNTSFLYKLEIDKEDLLLTFVYNVFIFYKLLLNKISYINFGDL